MSYPQAAWERAMTVQKVMLNALSGEIHWFRAADILGFSPRTLRRWRERYEKHGYRARGQATPFAFGASRGGPGGRAASVIGRYIATKPYQRSVPGVLMAPP